MQTKKRIPKTLREIFKEEIGMSDNGPTAVEPNWHDAQRIEALRLFRIFQGAGDAGSELEFNCRRISEQSGWMRLAAETLPPCSVCDGAGTPSAGDQSCICLGAGTREAEIANLRSGFNALRLEFNAITQTLRLLGYTVNKPSEILGAIERLSKRCLDAEAEFVKLKRRRVS